VEFTYRAIMDPGNMSPRAKRYGPVDRISTEGDYIFRIFLKHPFIPLMSRLGWPIAPRHLLERQKLGSTPFNRHPVGSGPFKLADWREDDTIVLDANREYFRKDRPILDRLVFRQYPDRESALQAISRGEMDIALNLTASDLLFVGRSGSFRVYPVSSPFYYALIFNLRDPLFRDIKVRKAMDHAIDKVSIARKLKSYECSGPFDAGSWAYNSHVKPTPRNLERARELLEQAGWRDVNGVLTRDGKSFEVSIGVLNASDILERIASHIKAQLAGVGIQVNLFRMDDSELYETPFQAIVAMIASGTDPEYARRTWHSGSGHANLASYRNSFVDDLMDLGRQTAELEKRKAIYHKIHEIIHDDCPAIFLASAYEYIGSRYQFRDRFTSIMHFLSTVRDWQIAGSVSTEQSCAAINQLAH
jgi:peptide/nickel transport system substrate-binding protein